MAASVTALRGATPEIDGEQAPHLVNMLRTLDAMRKRVLDGSVVAFGAVCIQRDDALLAYAASDPTASCTRLKMQGALAQLLHDYLDGALVDGDADGHA